MIVMGLDTTGPDCSVAIVRRDETLAHLTERIGRGHAERLGPMVLAALAEAALTARNIDRVAVCTGPGSFTGLRVALSFAKGFALPRHLPLIGIDRLTLALSHAPDALVVNDIKRGEAAIACHGETPLILSHTDAQARAERYAGPVIRDPAVDIVALARFARDASPADYPATAFYGRKPDAKLPGGIDPT